MSITDLLAAPLIAHQDRRDAGLPVHHSHLKKKNHPIIEILPTSFLSWVNWNMHSLSSSIRC